MKTKLIFSGLIILALISCRRNSSDDYKYYKPTPKDSVSVEIPDTLANVDTGDKESVKELVKEEIKGVDLVNDYYFVVVASYAVEEFAIAKKADLVAQGYKPGIFMVDDDGWYKLAIKSYKTFKEAEVDLNKLKQKQGVFSTARIVFKKRK